MRIYCFYFSIFYPVGINLSFFCMVMVQALFLYLRINDLLLYLQMESALGKNLDGDQTSEWPSNLQENTINTLLTSQAIYFHDATKM